MSQSLAGENGTVVESHDMERMPGIHLQSVQPTVIIFSRSLLRRICLAPSQRNIDVT